MSLLARRGERDADYDIRPWSWRRPCARHGFCMRAWRQTQCPRLAGSCTFMPIVYAAVHQARPLRLTFYIAQRGRRKVDQTNCIHNNISMLAFTGQKSSFCAVKARRQKFPYGDFCELGSGVLSLATDILTSQCLHCPHSRAIATYRLPSLRFPRSFLVRHVPSLPVLPESVRRAGPAPAGSARAPQVHARYDARRAALPVYARRARTAHCRALPNLLGAHGHLFLSPGAHSGASLLADLQKAARFHGAGEDEPPLPGRPCGHIFSKGENCFRCK
jgi:hypothetical protein